MKNRLKELMITLIIGPINKKETYPDDKTTFPVIIMIVILIIIGFYFIKKEVNNTSILENQVGQYN